MSRKPGLTRRQFMQSAAAVAAGAPLALRAHERDGDDDPDDGRVCGDAPDVNLVNGHFLTMDSRNSVARAIAIRNGRIARVGHPDDLGPCGRTINLKGATVIPGLIDSHVHYIRCGLNPGREVRIIETATSIGEMQAMIAARIRQLGADAPAGDFVTCVGGWNVNGLAENRMPTLAELDAAAPQHAVYLSTTGTGGAVTNSIGRAFFVSRGIAVSAIGTLSASAAFPALQSAQTDASKLQGTREAMDFAASLGMTMFHDHGGLSGLQPYSYALLLWRRGELKVRVRPWFWSGDDSGISVAETRVLNDFNMVGDDVWRQLGIGERINTSTTNPLNLDAWKFAAQQGWMVTQHSLTAAEVALHISNYQTAAQFGPIGALRWSLCHVNPITDAQIAAVKALGIALNIQGTSYTSTPGSAPSGPPFRKLLDVAIPCGGGSDATNVAAFNPWLMMSYMTTAKNNAGVVINGDQTITRLEALRMYTTGSAYLSFDDAKLGSLEEGKIADLAVLSDDPLTVSDASFKRLQSVLTMQAGRIVHQTL